jgi:hypothetical protein
MRNLPAKENLQRCNKEASMVGRMKRSIGAPFHPDEGTGSSIADAPPTPPVPGDQHKKTKRNHRRSNRTVQFATRVTPEFNSRLRAVADRDGLSLVELLECALSVYENGWFLNEKKKPQNVYRLKKNEKPKKIG